VNSEREREHLEMMFEGMGILASLAEHRKMK
jgi:hypothetical protein